MTDGYNIIQANLDRAQEDYDWAIKHGFSPKQPLYRLGTPVNSYGVENLKLSHRRWEENLLTQDDCDKHIEIIKKEEREDHKYNLRDFWMMIDGQLDGPEVLMPTEWSLRQMLLRSRVLTTEMTAEAVKQAADFVSNPYSPLNMRRDMVNHYLSTSKRDGWLRTRYNPNLRSRELYSVVSDRYNRTCTTDTLLGIIRDKLDENKNFPSRSETTYDGKIFRMSIVYHTFIEPEDCVAGEIFQSGVDLQWADDGSQRIRISPFVLRNLCLNLLILDRNTQTIELSHLKTDLQKEVKEAMDTALHSISGFAEKWSLANKESILDDVYTIEPEEVFKKLIKSGFARIPGSSKEETLQKLLTAWRLEPNERYTKAAIINAMTRAAQDNWSNPWASYNLEAQAGELLEAKLLLNFDDDNT